MKKIIFDELNLNIKTMCATTQTMSTGLVAKDFIAPAFTLFSTLMIATITYRGIFVKINRDRRVKWTDEVRKEVATFLSTIACNIENLHGAADKINFSMITLELYLDSSKEPQLRLQNLINLIMKSVIAIGNNKSFGGISQDERNQIYELLQQGSDIAREVLETELAEIEEIFGSN